MLKAFKSIPAGERLAVVVAPRCPRSWMLSDFRLSGSDLRFPIRQRTDSPWRTSDLFSDHRLPAADPPTDGLIRSHPALSPSPLGSHDLCRGCPTRSIRRGELLSSDLRLLPPRT